MIIARPSPCRRSSGLRPSPRPFASLLAWLALAAPCLAADGPTPPLTPEQGVRAWRTRPGLRVELVVAEPLVESPVAMDFGADGKLWVCEMRDYPMGIDGNWKPGGVVKVVEDRDGDGRYETATEFLDGLPFPTGVMAWRKGVLICAAPEVIYAEDTDGDGKADIRRPLLQGFATENFQARVNGLSYGLDNWVYGANGLIGGTIRGMAGGKEVNIGGRDFRMKPDTGAFEPASGLTQQGRVRDDWGNQFGGNNSVLIQHYPLPDHYARRNPRVAAPAPAVSVVRDADPALLFPASETVARFNHPESANRVTSACSPAIYRDDYLGKEYAGNAFACETVHNLVRRVVLEPSGATFAGHRAPGEESSEFLASTDPWCRPAQVRTGPDGALWVVDFYRAVIEHPRWISPETLKTLDVRAGAKMGRIYRVVADGRPLRPVARLESLAGADLAAAIDTPNGIVRDNVQRLLVHRGDRAAVPALANLARTSPRPEVRVQALGTLDGLGALDPALVLASLDDAHPGVRREAARLAESRLDGRPDLARKLIEKADDADPAVRFQVALSLGETSDPDAGRALGRIALRDGSDRWIAAAVLSSAVPHAGAILETLVAKAGPAGPSSALVEPLIATIAGSEDRGAVASALALLRPDAGKGPEAWRLGALAGLLDAAKDPRLADDPAVASTLASARDWASDREKPPAVRVAAIRLMGRSKEAHDADLAAIAGRLDPSEPAEIQVAAVQALARLGDRPAADAVVEAWARLGPTVRSGALDALMARPESTEALVSALEDGRIAPSLVDAAHRERLLGRGTDDHRSRVAKVFGPSALGPRKGVIEAFASAKTLPGDAGRGAQVFAKTCASCHKYGGVGHEVGPDLAALTDTSPEALLSAILDPNAEVDARYAVYTAALKDGRVLSGLIAAETGGAIILKRQEGGTDSILRADLEELATSGRSLMPEGLENDLTPADMAHLIAFLSRGANRAKTFPGNQPRVVAADANGSARLAAADAEIFGPSLAFETEFGNLGYWHAPDDRAAWTIRLERPVTFSATLDLACADGSEGNFFQIRAGDKLLKGKVPSTGGWDAYRPLWVGELTLPAGEHRVELRSAGPLRGALADVRALLLVPQGGVPPKPAPEPAAPTTVEERAKVILDPATPANRRAALLDVAPDASADLIAALAVGLDRADRAEEYRRIPWIWRVAIAAGKRNDAAELGRIIDAATPADGQPLAHWQAVVLGGGVINGITQAGAWPGARVDGILGDDVAKVARWRRALDLASAMTDDPAVPNGTRYDALRMIGLEPWARRGEQISRYLGRGVNGELQQGAVCALGDLPAPEATRALLDGLDGFTPGNRRFAIEALARDDDRREALLDALERGRVKAADLPEAVVKILTDPAVSRSHARARALLAK